MTAVDHLSKGAVAGTTLGQTASDLISLYNATPVAQASAITSVATTTIISVCGSFGFSTAAQASGIVTALNAVILALHNLGAIA